MRHKTGIVSVIAALAMATLSLGAGSVSAQTDPQTNTGTIKIFDGDKELPANDPKVCDAFTVQGLGFDATEDVRVTIVGQGGPEAGTGSFDQTVVTDAEGSFATAPITLPGGMYLANADDGEGGGDKNKVFKVECAPIVAPAAAAVHAQAAFTG